MRYIIILPVVLLLACQTRDAEVKNNSQQYSTSWNAFWISAGENTDNYDTTHPAPFFRKDFFVDKKIAQAHAEVTGVGYFEFYINGNKIGDQLLAPAVTRYDKRVKYLEFDISSYLRSGQNVAGSILGNGFYNVDTKSAWDFDQAPWRNRPAFLCRMVFQYEDGSSDTLLSDNTWKYTTGPIVFDQIRNGETYDANLEISGWNLPEYDDKEWRNAFVVKGPEGKLSRQVMPHIIKTKTLAPKYISEPKPGIYLVDFGQNISGWAKIRFHEKNNKKVIMKYGERIYDDGTLNQKELSRFIFTGKTQTTTYISNGRSVAGYEPRFTYFGFQYLQIEGLTEKPGKEDIDAFMIHTAFDTTGYFTCSNPLINKIYENIRWSYLGNYHSFPEDCPHREKMGWTGDAQLVVETGLMSFDAVPAYRKWLQDFMDEQQENGDLPGIIPTSGWGYTHGKNPETRQYGYGPHWEGAAIAIPWQLYRYTADTTILSEFYPMMKKYLLHLEDISVNNLLHFGIDDHKSIMTHTEGSYISSAYFHRFCLVMRKISRILGLEKDSRYFTQLGNKIFESFQNKYFKPEKISYYNDGQTALSLALACGLTPEKYKNQVFNLLVEKIEEKDYHFDAGVVGVKNVIDVLMDYNRTDVLYKMAIQRDFPSFGHWIEQGASTMWQNWDGSQSRNHIMFGSIGDYFYKGLAGINVIDTMPGFKQMMLKPQFPADMDSLTCKHKTRNGWMTIDWKKKNKIIHCQFGIPGGTEAFLSLPFPEKNIHEVTKKGKEYEPEYLESAEERSEMMMQPGRYTFRIIFE
jgi:alpha-L-rhamnosidase